ncbi:hypothetical protein BDW67DRAFT_8993 [Aspergillus spinulosporus]
MDVPALLRQRTDGDARLYYFFLLVNQCGPEILFIRRLLQRSAKQPRAVLLYPAPHAKVFQSPLAWRPTR